MGDRRHARELALQILYQNDVNQESTGDLDAFWEDHPASPEIRTFAETLVHGVRSRLDAIDALLQRHAEHWSISRMPAVDRNILRCALFELLYMDGIPAKVTLNEAIDLAKRYGSEKSGAFVNGVLDRVVHGETLPAGKD